MLRSPNQSQPSLHHRLCIIHRLSQGYDARYKKINHNENDDKILRPYLAQQPTSLIVVSDHRWVWQLQYLQTLILLLAYIQMFSNREPVFLYPIFFPQDFLRIQAILFS